MPEPIALAPKPSVADEIKEACVEILETALARAEAGEVLTCIVIMQHPNGHWSDERSGSLDFAKAVGQLEIVKQAWVNSYLREPK